MIDETQEQEQDQITKLRNEVIASITSYPELQTGRVVGMLEILKFDLISKIPPT